MAPPLGHLRDDQCSLYVRRWAAWVRTVRDLAGSYRRLSELTRDKHGHAIPYSRLCEWANPGKPPRRQISEGSRVAMRRAVFRLPGLDDDRKRRLLGEQLRCVRRPKVRPAGVHIDATAVELLERVVGDVLARRIAAGFVSRALLLKSNVSDRLIAVTPAQHAALKRRGWIAMEGGAKVPGRIAVVLAPPNESAGQ